MRSVVPAPFLFFRARGRCAAALFLLLVAPAYAALGGDKASVLADQQSMGTQSSTHFMAGTTVYTQAWSQGVTVRQYVDAAGRVFAVGWDGPVPPDFARLLGSYFPDFQETQRQQKRGVSLASAQLVLEAGGRMRAFMGRAYLPHWVPPALDTGLIR